MSTGGSNGLGWGKIVLIAAGISTVISVPGMSYVGSLIYKDLENKIVSKAQAASAKAVDEKLEQFKADFYAEQRVLDANRAKAKAEADKEFQEQLRKLIIENVKPRQ